MSRLLRILIVIFTAAALPAAAQDLSALARVDAAQSGLFDRGKAMELSLTLSQPVPYRLRLLDGPPRLVIDFNEVTWAGVHAQDLNHSLRVETVSAGGLRPGWSRMAVVLTAPMVINRAQLRVDEGTAQAILSVRMEPASQDIFATHLSPAEKHGPKPVLRPARRNSATRPLRVVLDPGHGGIDPGAERDGVRESDLMLTFARELKDELRRAGMEVIMTREDDVFVPLESRISIAHAARADVMLSLHADALAEGRASGATIYTLSETASDEASEKLAERHDRADLLAGVDLSNQDDVIAGVLMDLARLETAPRSDQLAEALVEGLRHSVGGLHKRPRLRAGFSVLKSPSFPSVLVELGFISSARDRKNLTDPNWRARAAQGIRDALQVWSVEDAARADLVRQ